MNNLLTSYMGNATAPDGASIAFTLHVQPRDGSPARPCIVLIHSLALDRHIWDGVVPLLTPHADVLTFDCRGHGQSARVE
ncbi:MAG: alpha/beta fold hydrolase, partial [Bradyrhizobium sp.]